LAIKFFKKENSIFNLCLHVFTFWNIVVSWPLYLLIWRDPQFLIAYDFSPLEVIVFSLVLSILLPGVLVVFLILFNQISTRLGKFFTLSVLGMFSIIFCLQFFKNFNYLFSGIFIIILSFIVGIFLIHAYFKSFLHSKFIIFISPINIILPIFFLFLTPVSKIFLNQKWGYRHFLKFLFP